MGSDSRGKSLHWRRDWTSRSSRRNWRVSRLVVAVVGEDGEPKDRLGVSACSSFFFDDGCFCLFLCPLRSCSILNPDPQKGLWVCHASLEQEAHQNLRREDVSVCLNHSLSPFEGRGNHCRETTKREGGCRSSSFIFYCSQQVRSCSKKWIRRTRD